MRNVKIYRQIEKLNDIDLFYIDTKTDAPVIVCLHGLWGRAETWMHFIREYGEKYRIIAPDMRGHGLSSKPDSSYTAEEMTEDVNQLLTHLKIDSAILVGHSQGGRIATYFATMYPEKTRALAILDKSPKVNLVGYDDIKSGIDPFTKDWPLPFPSLEDAKSYIKSVSESDLEYEYMMNSLTETIQGYEMMFSSKAISLIKLHEKEWYHILPEIKCLTLIIRAKGGEEISNEDLLKMKSSLTNCIYYEMSHGDHNVHLANKEEFYGYFNTFLEKI